MRSNSTGLAVVIGANAREFRSQAGLTLDQVSRAARARGLKWSESRVADFEAGRVASPSINTLITFVLTLNDAGCEEVTLPALFKWINPVQVNETIELEGGEIINLLAGEPVRKALQAEDVVVPELRGRRTLRERKILRAHEVDLKMHHKVSQAQGAAETRVSSTLKIHPLVLAKLTASLWGSTFTDERDKRAGHDANAQRRGQISRAMQAELVDAISRATRGDD